MKVRVGNSSDFGLGKGWYFNSMRPLVEDVRSQRPISFDNIFKDYENLYNVKLYFDSFGFVDAVEFPSEDEATMFMLRWS